MADTLPGCDPFPQALPGYEVHFTIYGSGVTCTIFDVAYRAGRRRVVRRINRGIQSSGLPEASAESEVAFLCRQLADLLYATA